MSESKVGQFFRYGNRWEWRRCNHRSFTRTGQCTTNLQYVPIGPLVHTRGSGSSAQRLGFSSASDIPHTLPFPATRHLSSANPGNTISCISFDSFSSDYTYLSEDHLRTYLVPFK
jgi:hypothetical protein